MVRLIGEPFAEAAVPEGPPCSCPSCEQAWRRNQAAMVRPAAATSRTRKIGLG